MADVKQGSDTWDALRGFEPLSRRVQRQTREPITVKAPVGRPQPRMGDANSPKMIAGFSNFAGHPVPDGLYPIPKIDFSDSATPWERRCSILCPGGGPFAPVLYETPLLRKLGMATVGGHRGSVPFDAMWAYGPVVVDPETGLIGGEGFVFVTSESMNRDPTPRGVYFIGNPQTTYDVLTTVDGQVLAILGASCRDGVRDANWVIDAVVAPALTPFVAPVLVPALVRLAAGTTRLCTVLVARAGNRLARSVMAGATRELVEAAVGKGVGTVASNLVKDVGLARAMAARGLKLGGYDARMGIPRRVYDAQVAAARETGLIPVFRANKGEKAIRLMEQGAAPKPQAFKFKSDPDTAVLTAKTAADVKVVYQQRYYIVDPDGVARRSFMDGTRAVTEELPLRNVYWAKRPGQVIHPDGHPVIGDIDMAGAIPLKSPGQLIAEVPKDVANGDWMSPHVRRFANAVNPKLDRPRVLHGAQENFLSEKYGGLTDDIGYAVFADGQAVVLTGRAEYEAFWEAFGRKTVMGTYSPTGPAVPPPKTSTPGLRVVK